MIGLGPVRLVILKKVYPAYGEATRPADLYERDEPEIFVLPIKRDFGDWTIIGVLNYDENVSMERQISMDRLRVYPSKTYGALECWSQRLQGEVTKQLQLHFDPSSVVLLSLHEKTGVPHVISSDRHYGQAALELESVEWDQGVTNLRVVSLGPMGSRDNGLFTSRRNMFGRRSRPATFMTSSMVIH